MERRRIGALRVLRGLTLKVFWYLWDWIGGRLWDLSYVKEFHGVDDYTVSMVQIRIYLTPFNRCYVRTMLMADVQTRYILEIYNNHDDFATEWSTSYQDWYSDVQLFPQRKPNIQFTSTVPSQAHGHDY